MVWPCAPVVPLQFSTSGIPCPGDRFRLKRNSSSLAPGNINSHTPRLGAAAHGGPKMRQVNGARGVEVAGPVAGSSAGQGPSSASAAKRSSPLRFPSTRGGGVAGEIGHIRLPPAGRSRTRGGLGSTIRVRPAPLETRAQAVMGKVQQRARAAGRQTSQAPLCARQGASTIWKEGWSSGCFENNASARRGMLPSFFFEAYRLRKVPLIESLRLSGEGR